MGKRKRQKNPRNKKRNVKTKLRKTRCSSLDSMFPKTTGVLEEVPKNVQKTQRRNSNPVFPKKESRINKKATDVKAPDVKAPVFPVCHIHDTDKICGGNKCFSAQDPNFYQRIYKNLLIQEKRFPTQQINHDEKYEITYWEYRQQVVKWLRHQADVYRLSWQTLLMSVSLLDRCTNHHGRSGKNVHIESLRRAGLASLWIACKYEEVSPPCISGLVDNICSEEELKQYESFILKSLDWCAVSPTVSDFLLLYDKNIKDKCLKNLAYFFLDIFLQSSTFVTYYPSHLAAASITLAALYSNESLLQRCFQQFKCEYTPNDIIPVCTQLNNNYIQFHDSNGVYCHRTVDEQLLTPQRSISWEHIETVIKNTQYNEYVIE